MVEEISIPKDELAKLRKDSTTLHELKDLNPKKMLTPNPEEFFTSLTKHKLNASDQIQEREGRKIIYAQNKKGGPITLQRITEPRKRTSEITSRTQAERNRNARDFERATCCPSTCIPEEINESVLLQRATQIRSDRHVCVEGILVNTCFLGRLWHLTSMN